ncbi:flagellar biosynthetic protein FliR [Caldanaerovirga acetigignens]|uniref:Flagellar biosynthetic protein FliR n=1 Tax=Caldanaerovirga acetigignens TaxID=447595 RepID=A0A1M7G4I1_9FIRM|nr:flagellar biosynthetic protein FliR [Caldanaerovirga acetigignens]SHM11055.1 flagellar biosynthetic protein FliR [Caldanaerovirga acetigignens]
MEEQITIFLMVLTRIFGFFAVAPFFGRREFPFQARAGLAALVTSIIYPIVSKNVIQGSVWETVALFVKEAAVGFLMGFIVFIMFSAVYILGEIVDFEMGFGIVSVLDPQINTQVPILGNFFYILTILIFLSINGHHVLLGMLIRSFEVLPLGASGLTKNLLYIILESFYGMFEAGVKMSLPLIFSTFLADFALGIMARTVPHMNVFIVGLPFKIVIGILFLIIILPTLLTSLEILFTDSYEILKLIIQGMAKKP